MKESLAAEWGWFRRATRSVSRWTRRAVRKVATTARRVGGRIVHIATKTFNWAKNKARALAHQFAGYARQIKLMKWIKYAVDRFFRYTESRRFKSFFKRVVGGIMKRYGLKKRHVDAAYKLLTRRFWSGQFWMWKWIFTGGFVRSAKSYYGYRDFYKATRVCKDFVTTVDLGGAIMRKMEPFKQV